MNTKEFNQKAIEILKEYGCKESKDTNTDLLRFSKNTRFGTILISLDTDKSKVFTVLMRFEKIGFNFSEFDRAFLTDGFDSYTRKWNIHHSCALIAFDTLENRLEGLTYPE